MTVRAARARPTLDAKQLRRPLPRWYSPSWTGRTTSVPPWHLRTSNHRRRRQCLLDSESANHASLPAPALVDSSKPEGFDERGDSSSSPAASSMLLISALLPSPHCRSFHRVSPSELDPAGFRDGAARSQVGDTSGQAPPHQLNGPHPRVASFHDHCC